ncbi:MAG: tyrosine-type recombinase/integrase, partial [Comamonas sp.]
MNDTAIKEPAYHRAVVLKNYTPKDLVTASKERCLEIQHLLGLGNKWGRIELPYAWMPPGIAQDNRLLNLVDRFASTEASPEAQDLAVLQVTRFGLLYFLVSTPSSKGRILAAPVTWKDNMRIVALMAQAGLNKPSCTPGCVLSHLSPQDLVTINRGRRINGILSKLKHFSLQYGWYDHPNLTSVQDYFEADRQGGERPLNLKYNGIGFQPLPDAFIAQAGWRVIWLVEQLGPDLLKCARSMLEVMNRTPLTANSYSMQRFRRDGALRDFLASWQWTDLAGNPLTKLPFRIQLGRRFKSDEWPPKRPSDITELLTLLQTAHLFVFLLSTGGRISEALSIRRECIAEVNDEVTRIQGRTYKLVFSNNGRERDWPIPSICSTALRQQEALAGVLDQTGPLYSVDDEDSAENNLAPLDANPLWMTMMSKGHPMKASYLTYLRRMVKSLGLTEAMDDMPLHPHRFRKSIARLIALAIVAGAPKILMDLFGHEKIEAALYYILSDPAIRSEMEEVAKAQIIMLAENAIENADSNGGPAATGIRKAVAKERARRGEQFGENDVHMLAQTFTFSGKIWSLVRPRS